jgi:hypothetical protein
MEKMIFQKSHVLFSGSQVEDFLRLAKTLGIKGFSIEANKENEISSNLKERNG